VFDFNKRFPPFYLNLFQNTHLNVPEKSRLPHNGEHELEESTKDLLVIIQLNADVEGLHPRQILQHSHNTW
jgi:hypothetical protein